MKIQATINRYKKELELANAKIRKLNEDYAKLIDERMALAEKREETYQKFLLDKKIETKLLWDRLLFEESRLSSKINDVKTFLNALENKKTYLEQTIASIKSPEETNQKT